MASPAKEKGQQLETVPMVVETFGDGLAWVNGNFFTRSSTLVESEKGEREFRLVAGRAHCLLAMLAARGEVDNEMARWSDEKS